MKQHQQTNHPTDEMKKYINRYINITVFLCFVMKVCKKEKKKQIPNFLKKKPPTKKQNKKPLQI